MRRRFFASLILWIALVPALCQSLPAEEMIWQIGIAKTKITPDRPLWMAGYGNRTKPAEGTLHDLWIKVLALETAGGDRAVVLTSDLLGFTKGLYDDVCAELAAECQLERSRIMLTASHTHTGPVLEDALYDIYPLDERDISLIVEYSRNLKKTIVATVVEAFGRLSPATLWAAEGTADFAVNRRENSESQVIQARQSGMPLEGPVDHDVPVLAVKRSDDSLQAVVFGYACHATTLSFNQWSGDYPGFAQIAMEEGHPETTAMFFAGCGADQNPLPRRSVELCEKYGRALAAAVQDVLEGPMRPIASRLETALEFVDLPYGNQPGKAELEAAASKGAYWRRRAERLIGRLDDGQSFQTSYSYPVQVWKLGQDQLWIALGGEVVVDYSLAFKSQYGKKTWVAGYTNDVMSYIPSGRIWKEGGYESGAFYVYGLPADGWAPDVEERITACVRRLTAPWR